LGEDTELTDNGNTAEREYEKMLARDEVWRLLSRLPDSARRIIKHTLAGWSISEIARHEGVSEGAVRVRLYRAKERMRGMKLSI